MTRARGNLYFIEIDTSSTRGKKTCLADFAFRQFKNLRLLQLVTKIDEGAVDLTPQEHKVRGVLLVVMAINMSRNNEETAKVKEKFEEAAEHFQADKGNDKQLLDQCNKHLNCFEMHRGLIETMKKKFFNKDLGVFDLKGKFKDILEFEANAAKFVRECANDSFLVDEIQDTRARIEECFFGTPVRSFIIVGFFRLQ